MIARAVGIGIVSHLVLDVVTHARDIAFWPGGMLPAFGLGLYDRAPMWGFALEMAYGLVCWRVYRGSRSLLTMIILGNLANITLFSAAIPGPGHYLAGHPLLVVTMVFVQIVVTLVLIGVLARRTALDSGFLKIRGPSSREPRRVVGAARSTLQTLVHETDAFRRTSNQTRAIFRGCAASMAYHETEDAWFTSLMWSVSVAAWPEKRSPQAFRAAG